jgi:hypothetical protein
MNYRTCFDTTNLPANTKKNIKAYNQTAAAAVAAAASDDKNKKTPANLKALPGAANSDSDTDDDDTSGASAASTPNQTAKEKKKAEWYAMVSVFLLLSGLRALIVLVWYELLLMSVASAPEMKVSQLLVRLPPNHPTSNLLLLNMFPYSLIPLFPSSHIPIIPPTPL